MPSADPSGRERQVNEIIAAWYDSPSQGNWRELLTLHPELAAELEEFFQDQERANGFVGTIDAGGRELPRSAASAHASPTPTARIGPRGEFPLRVGVEHVAVPNSEFGDYRILEELGRGGMGLVCKARHLPLNRIVALKLLLSGPTATQEDLQRFRAEAESAARLDHPHIVPVHEVGERGGCPFFSMKLIEGRSLAQIVNGERWAVAADPSSTIVDAAKQRWGAQVLAQVARAVHHAHCHGILHRDLKPGNILLEEPRGPSDNLPSPPTAFVSDFGLAKRLEVDSQLTQTGAIVGTPAYMAPEQAVGAKLLTPAADIYSLGAILYHVLTGRKPFAGDTPIAVLTQVQTKDPAPPSRINSRVDRELETICLKCLDKEPSRRYSSAEELADDLERWLGGMPIRARPMPRWRRALRWTRRRPLITSLAALILVLIVGGLSVSVWLRREREERHSAESSLYWSRLALAQKELADRQWDVGSKHLLECPSAMRSWEWDYLKGFCDRQRSREVPGPAMIAAIAVSNDGKLLANADTKGTITLRSLDDKSDAVSMEGGKPAATTLSFSPDGKRLAFGCDNGTIHICDAATGKSLLSFAKQHKGKVLSLRYSPDGRFLATSGSDRRVILWNADTGQTSREFPVQARTSPCVCFSPDSGKLATANGDMVHLWNVENAKPLGEHKLDGQAEVKSITFSPDGHWLAAGGGAAVTGTMLCIWDVASGKLVQHLANRPVDPFAPPPAPEPNPAGVSLNLRTLNFQHLHFHKNGRHLVTLGRNQVFVLEIQPRPVPIDALRASSEAACLALGGDGSTLAVGCIGKIDIWNLTDVLKDLPLSAESLSLTSLGFSADGTSLAGGDEAGKIRIWNAGTGRLLHDLAPGLGRIHACENVDKDRWLVAGQRADFAMVDSTGREGAIFRGHADGPVWSLALDADRRRVASAGADQKVLVWEVGAARVDLTLDAPARRVLFQPGGGRLAAACSDGVVRIWDATGKQRLAIPGQDDRCLAFRPDGKHLVTREPERGLQVWDVDSGRLVRTLAGSVEPLADLAYSADGKRIVGIGKDLRIWDAAADTLESGITLTIPGSANAMAFSPDGARLAVHAGTLRILDAKH